MPTAHRIRPEARRVVMEALTAMAWADGEIDPSEILSLRGAAVAFGMPELIDQIDVLLAEGPTPLHELGLRSLERDERCFTYAAVVWMALSDGVRSSREGLVLQRIRVLLGIDRHDAEMLEDAAFEVYERGSARSRWRQLERLVLRVMQRVTDETPTEEAPVGGEDRSAGGRAA